MSGQVWATMAVLLAAAGIGWIRNEMHAESAGYDGLADIIWSVVLKMLFFVGIGLTAGALARAAGWW